MLTLAEELKADGIVNKKGVPFSPESMYYMLHLERYAGRYTVNGILYDNIFPRTIPEEIFQQVQKRLEANRHGKHVPGVEYILKENYSANAVILCVQQEENHAARNNTDTIVVFPPDE